MLIVEQNAALALELAEHAYLLETGRIVTPGGVRGSPRRRSGPPLLSRVLGSAMELLLQQVMAGLATGAIYACMALAVVMIYQAIDHLNFAQGEMAMFSTFIAWQLMHGACPTGWPSSAVALSFLGGVADRAGAVPADPQRADAQQPRRLHRAVQHPQQLRRLDLGLHDQDLPDPVRHAAVVRQRLIATHEAGMIGVTLVMLGLLYLFFRGTRLGLAMRAAARNPESARLVGIRVGWMTALGWGMAAAIGAVAGMLIAPVVFLEPNMMLGVLLYGFAGAVLGGLTSPGGAVAGGFASASSRTSPAPSSPMSAAS